MLIGVDHAYNNRHQGRPSVAISPVVYADSLASAMQHICGKEASRQIDVYDSSRPTR